MILAQFRKFVQQGSKLCTLPLRVGLTPHYQLPFVRLIADFVFLWQKIENYAEASELGLPKGQKTIHIPESAHL